MDRGPRLDDDPKSVLAFIIKETAPRCAVVAENNRPFLRPGNYMQAVGAGFQRFAFYFHIMGKRDGGVFVCARSPGERFPRAERNARRHTIRNNLSPDNPASYAGTVIVNPNILYADPLRRARCRTHPGQTDVLRNHAGSHNDTKPHCYDENSNFLFHLASSKKAYL